MSTTSPTERFTDRVTDYIRYRPGYPTQLLTWLQQQGIASQCSVADIGAGTGISSRMFLEAGHPVTIVEPNAAMRHAAEHALQHFPGFRSLSGTAENTTLPPASTDLISAAQAFHWFDQEAIKPEWRRILRPGGLVVVYWNSRLLSGNTFLEGYERLLLEYGTDYSTVAERYNDDESMRRWFGQGFHGMARLPNHQLLDFDGLRGRLLSSSYAPKAGHSRYAEMLTALQQLFDNSAINGKVSFDYETRAFIGTLS
ncbi:MAG: class I SAM-dependent methyltransferase [Xanthomonadaceae bacterium]|jgi:SAM-dependent methyltransferase|nr:class I SAM-dependent methyltransferase [Xanthomonadaceae bacterium]